MIAQLFYFVLLQHVLAFDTEELKSLCQRELQEIQFPISCYHHLQRNNQKDSVTALRGCRQWVSRQRNEKTLFKVKSSEAVSEACKNAAQDQIELLQYQGG